jgi:uroporphyrinogen decarboxylase
MTSRERVYRAVKFAGPDRIPISLPEPFGSDFCGAGPGNDPDWTPCVQTETQWEDEFGSIWTKLHGDKTMGQVTGHPLGDYADVDRIHWPDYTKAVRYESARAAVAANADDKFVLAGIPLSLIHRLEYLRGHEQAWTDPYEHPVELTALLNRLADIGIDAIDRLADCGVQGVISCDDWGLQDRPMLSPATFERFWQPVYHRVYRRAHERGMLTFLHSCGHIADLLDHFIAAELDVIQMDQQENMGVAALAERFGGRLCFWCPVDIQNTMVRGTVADVRAYARLLMDSFGGYNGGFIAQWYASPQAVEHSQEKIEAMSQEFVAYGGRFYDH